MDRDEMKGKVEKAKGYVKEKAGEITDDPTLEAEGKIDRASGAVRESFGKAKRKVKEGIEEIADDADAEEE
ncbi:MAG: CsbD family protein [Candidatus Rokuibacteriota bacterium]|nr:MAG: CsbD family protein [Candidatus Rokubacteria bacterium]